MIDRLLISLEHFKGIKNNHETVWSKNITSVCFCLSELTCMVGARKKWKELQFLILV